MPKIDELGIGQVLAGFTEGIVEGMKFNKQLDLEKKKIGLQKEAAKKKDIISPKDALDLSRHGEFVAPGTEGTIDVDVQTSEGIRTYGFRRIPSQREQEVTKLRQLQIDKLEREAAEAAKDPTKTRTFITTEEKEKRREERAVAREKEKERRKAQVPGFEFTDPEIIPKAKDAQAIKDGVAQREEIRVIVDRMAKRIKKHGVKTGVWPNKELTDTEQDLATLKIKAKEIDKLGALTAPDVPLIEARIGKVIGMKALFTEALDSGSAIGRLRTFEQSAQDKINSMAKATGYRAIRVDKDKDKEPPLVPKGRGKGGKFTKEQTGTLLKSGIIKLRD